MWMELFAEPLAHLLASAITRIKGWREYRRHYSAAERREHRRQLAAADAPPGANHYRP